MAAPIVLALTERPGIWRLTRNGVFFGDYRSKQLALDDADQAALSWRRAGSTVTFHNAKAP